MKNKHTAYMWTFGTPKELLTPENGMEWVEPCFFLEKPYGKSLGLKRFKITIEHVPTRGKK
ncbi:MAG: hypothetical protein KGJ13_13065 [Patescibacteria group bacterium]|nr:hypothetical protein [Patescibacteria group bacterium]